MRYRERAKSSPVFLPPQSGVASWLVSGWLATYDLLVGNGKRERMTNRELINKLIDSDPDVKVFVLTKTAEGDKKSPILDVTASVNTENEDEVLIHA